MTNKYLTPTEFKDFCINQDKLINILNHRMTGIEGSMVAIKNDVGWVKRLMWAMMGIATAIFTAVLLKFLGGY